MRQAASASSSSARELLRSVIFFVFAFAIVATGSSRRGSPAFVQAFAPVFQSGPCRSPFAAPSADADPHGPHRMQRHRNEHGKTPDSVGNGESHRHDRIPTQRAAGNRRRFVRTAGLAVIGTLVGMPRTASAGIDVSGIRVDGSASASNPTIANQLKAYDGSAASRVKEAKEAAAVSSYGVVKSNAPAQDPVGIATWAYRAAPSFAPQLTAVGPLKNLYRCNDQIVAPESTGRRALNVQFEFPSDWLQLDRQSGGLQYVDQRNGDKLYLLRARLPPDTTLDTVPKSYIGEALFNPQGSIARSGNTIEDYKVSSAQILSDCPAGTCSTRRRFRVKYATVTGNGLRVERRALVDAYEIPKSDVIAMLVASSNAIKFDQKNSMERETAENIVASFQVE